jgi:archaeal flagellar protein FlaI
VDVWNYEIIREGEEVVLRVNCEQLDRVPSLEEDSLVMAKTIDTLIEVGRVTKIIFFQKMDYEYDYAQTQLLTELALLLGKLAKDTNILSMEAVSKQGKCMKNAPRRYAELQNIIIKRLREDPFGGYVELKRLVREERMNLDREVYEEEAECTKSYIILLQGILKALENTKMVGMVKTQLEGHHVGDRELYRNILRPLIKPDFIYTKLISSYPAKGEEIDNYSVGETEVTVFKFPDTVKYLYHITPPEFKLSEEEYTLLDSARKVMAEHKPTREEFVNPERMRDVFFHVGRDLIEELARGKNLTLRPSKLDLLTRILVRYTVGFGLIEVLLQDEKIQDVSVNSPLGRIPVFIVHADYADCDTNILPTRAEAESWATKLRMISGRPLDEANPILDTELRMSFATARVSAISEPLDPSGVAYSFRRHRNRPWTLPLFMKHNMVNALGAGLLSFFVDGTRTMLIAGTRSSGKSSFLSSMMVEIMRRYRIITVEDTLELPVHSLRDLGFNIQPLKVASALVKGSSEVSAEDGIRSTLRLGDSSLIVGEVRSKEALALYEAMRVGAAANVVAGTIHGDSPYGVYDRVVNDIGIPKTSFKATDIIIVANPIKSADGIHRNRRITQITEVRKHWENDPLLEHGFVDLMKYDSRSDQLDITDDLLNGESEVLKNIAANIPDFAGNWDALWNNIELRAKCKESQLKWAEKLNDFELLEAPFTIRCNDQFHLLSEKVKEESGNLDPKRIGVEWEAWLKRELKKWKLQRKGE